MRTVVTLLSGLLLLASPARADEEGAARYAPGSEGALQYVDDLVGALGKKDQALALVEQRVERARREGAPAWALVVGDVTLGGLLLKAGRVEPGLAALGRAVEQGYSDWYGFHQDVPKALWADERVKALYARLRLRRGDAHELQWHRSEQLATSHDTNMMITGNMGRKDGEPTRIHQSALPTRASASPTVLAARELTRWAQAYQRVVVQKSDQSRILHLMNMATIRRMPGTSPAEYERREREHQQQVLASRLEAERSALARAEAVRRRAFRPLLADADEPCPLPPLGSLAPDAAPAAEVPAGKGLRNPMLREGALKVGDWYRFQQVVRTEGAEVQGEYYEVIKGVEPGKAVTTEGQLKGMGDEQKKTERIELCPTLEEQLLSALRRQGAVKLLRTSTTSTTHELQGQEVPARRCTLEVEWSLPQGAVRCTLTCVQTDRVPGAGVVALELRLPQMVITQRLAAFGRGGQE